MEPETSPTRVVHRTITTADLPFITNSWLRSNCKRGYRRLEGQLYYYWHHRLLEALIPLSNVIVACDADDPAKVYGYGVAQYDGPTLVVHYLYTRDGWRKQGIARSILQAWLDRYEPMSVVWTHATELGETFIHRLRRVLTLPGVFNPYLAFRQWGAAESAMERRNK